MEHQLILNLLNESSDSKSVTKNGILSLININQTQIMI